MFSHPTKNWARLVREKVTIQDPSTLVQRHQDHGNALDALRSRNWELLLSQIEASLSATLLNLGF